VARKREIRRERELLDLRYGPGQSVKGEGVQIVLWLKKDKSSRLIPTRDPKKMARKKLEGLVN